MMKKKNKKKNKRKNNKRGNQVECAYSAAHRQRKEVCNTVQPRLSGDACCDSLGCVARPVWVNPAMFIWPDMQ